MDGDRFAAAAARLAGLTGAVLGWRPDEFWAATPAELAAIFDALAPPGAAPPTQGDLTRLRERFPDG
ncbi:phage tail assembly chaperone [Sphingomonas sp. SUN039]|uniref:phage tail assembly chaperone n=1 Tax=Sphingomonas sp. SUN039 TaxID=2937787 RepID=UPI002164C343|nr:phage tail assembly chaperone [Sphingomonas sp. SUN039]UVO52972.1 phage tail assembly chaperone [Sphingomonas sp. SUN039]